MYRHKGIVVRIGRKTCCLCSPSPERSTKRGIY